MFGRVRAAASLSSSSSSVDDRLERPSSKIFKDDPLSIYEATLIKLKLGSQRNINPPPPEEEEEAAEEMGSDCSSTPIISTNCTESSLISTCTNVIEHSVTSPDDEEEAAAMAIDTYSCSRASILSSSSSLCQSRAGDSEKIQSCRKNMPLLYLFSKYNTSRRELNSSLDRALMGGINYYDSSSSVSNSPTSSQSFGNTLQENS